MHNTYLLKWLVLLDDLSLIWTFFVLQNKMTFENAKGHYDGLKVTNLDSPMYLVSKFVSLRA